MTATSISGREAGSIAGSSKQRPVQRPRRAAGLAYVRVATRAPRDQDRRRQGSIVASELHRRITALQERRAYTKVGKSPVRDPMRGKSLAITDPQREFPFYSSALGRGKVVLGGETDRPAIDAATERPQTFKTRDESIPRGRGRGKVYVARPRAAVLLDLATGRSLQEFDAGAPISASPAIAAGHLVVGTQDGRIYCFGG